MDTVKCPERLINLKVQEVLSTCKGTERSSPPSISMSYRFPHYYRIIMNALCILCLYPYWISFNGKSVVFHSNRFHRLICYCIHGVVWIYTCPYFLGSIKDVSLMKDPSGVFYMFNSLLWCATFYVMSYVCIFRQCRIQKLMELPRKDLDFRTRVTQLGIFTSLAALVWLLHVTYVTKDGVLMGSFEEVLQELPLEILAFFGKHKKAGPDGFEINEVIIYPCIFLLEEVQVIVFLVTFIITFVECLAAHEIASSTYASAKKLGLSLNDGITLFVTAKKVMAKLNRLSSGSLLCIFTSQISYIAWKLPDVLDGQFWPFAPFCVISTFLCVWGTFLAAEAYETMRKVEKRLKQIHVGYTGMDHRVCVSLSTLNLIENCPGDMGLSGGSFFTLTYPLLGESFSVFLTYCIIMIQFEASKPSDIVLS